MSATAMGVTSHPAPPPDEVHTRILSGPLQPPSVTPHYMPTGKATLPAQLFRFSVVGLLNTAIDVLALNVLLWLFHLHTTPQILLVNAAAYALGAVNSFVLNKRWTFRRRSAITRREVGRFALATLAGIALNDALLWAIARALLPILGPTALWATGAKAGAIGGTVLLSFLGMRLWVFAAQRAATPRNIAATPRTPARSLSLPLPPMPIARTAREPSARMPDPARDRRIAVSSVLAHYSLSVVLPAYNEERAIAATLAEAHDRLDEWGAEYEVIVVNDGSRDRTGDELAAYASRDPHVRVVTHTTNQGYGAALASGFAAAAKDLTFFMDSDGQFTVVDLPRLLVHIPAVDAVLGYRVHREDSWMRLANAWGWKALVFLTLGVRVRDLDCAYKLFRTEFLHAHPPTTGGALVNAELVYTLDRTGATYCEVGVRHLPRQGGRATGASPRVIARALRDLAIYTWRQRVQRRPRGRTSRSPSPPTSSTSPTSPSPSSSSPVA